MRMLTSEARVDAHRFRGGFLGEQDYGRLSQALGTLHDAKVFIDDTASIGILEMRAKARRLKPEHGLDLLVIDYLQLMQGRGRFDNRQQELASISRSLKILAKELERADRRAVAAQPRARDARRPSSAALGPARVGRARAGRGRRHVHLPRGHVPTTAEREPEVEGIAEIIIGKQRNGPTGTVKLAFLKQYTRFENLAHGARDDASVIRPTVATVDLGRHPQSTSTRSARFARLHVRDPAPRHGIIAVVKANAYGHGAPQVALALEAAGASMLACADIEEGVVLRQAGVRAPILVFGALSVSDLDGVFEHDLTPTISTPGAARALEAAAADTASHCRCHLKIDTGMNRLGFRARQSAADAAGAWPRSSNLSIDAVYTHFATADDPDIALFEEQRERFDRRAAAAARRSASRRRAPRGQQRRAAAR